LPSQQLRTTHVRMSIKPEQALIIEPRNELRFRGECEQDFAPTGELVFYAGTESRQLIPSLVLFLKWMVALLGHSIFRFSNCSPSLSTNSSLFFIHLYIYTFIHLYISFLLFLLLAACMCTYLRSLSACRLCMCVHLLRPYTRTTEAHTHAFAHARIYEFTSAYTHANTHLAIPAILHVHTLYTCVHSRVRAYAHAYVHTCVYQSIRPYIRIYMLHTYGRAHVHAYIDANLAMYYIVPRIAMLIVLACVHFRSSPSVKEKEIFYTF
jgi:hypothetical protein